MIPVRELCEAEEKSSVCQSILRALPSWFGNREAIVSYGEKVRSLPLFAAWDGDRAVGFVALEAHNKYTCEVTVMGILPEYHRQGLGRRLIACCEARCLEEGREFLTVKTLDGSVPSEGYDRTRRFYHAMGFRPLEVFPLYWDADNPCLFLAKHLHP